MNRFVSTLITCCLVTCALFAAPQQPDSITGTAPQLEHPQYDQLIGGEVLRVLDVNTILIRIEGKNTRYNLLGISSTGLDAAQKSQAIDALSRLLLGERIKLQPDPSDTNTRSSRAAAFVYRKPDHLCVNLELVRQGYVRYSDARMSIHTKVFDHYQSAARELHRGIWGAGTPAFLESESSEQQPDSNTPEPQPQPVNTPPHTIYITKYGTKYHREGCSHLTDTATRTTRDKVQDTHKPCKTCKPDQP